MKAKDLKIGEEYAWRTSQFHHAQRVRVTAKAGEFHWRPSLAAGGKHKILQCETELQRFQSRSTVRVEILNDDGSVNEKAYSTVNGVTCVPLRQIGSLWADYVKRRKAEKTRIDEEWEHKQRLRKDNLDTYSELVAKAKSIGIELPGAPMLQASRSSNPWVAVAPRDPAPALGTGHQGEGRQRMTTIDQVIDRVRKLLALSTSSNPHEAASAAARAQEILDRYELDRAMIETSPELDEGEQEPVEDTRLGGDLPLFEDKALPTWKSCLAREIAEANGCKVYASGQRGEKAVAMIGRRSDMQKVRYLFGYLVTEVDRLARRDGKGMGRTWINSYRLGAVCTIKKALWEARATMKAEARAEAQGDSVALVRVDRALSLLDARLRDAKRFAEEHLNLKRQARPARRNAGAYECGQKAGREVSIGGARGALGSGKRQIRG
jgi:hypothetical protein